MAAAAAAVGGGGVGGRGEELEEENENALPIVAPALPMPLTMEAAIPSSSSYPCSMDGSCRNSNMASHLERERCWGGVYGAQHW